MATTGTLTTYDIVGIKEDISDVITNISPTKTPFQSMIGNEGIHNTLFEWQEDSLFAAEKNSAVEGATAPAAVAQATVMRNNRTQILTKTAQASGTADVVSKYGRAKELSYQLGLRSAELKRDLEVAFVGTGQTAVVGNDSTARQMAGYQAQIDGSVLFDAGAGAVVGDTAGVANAPGNTTASLAESFVLSISQDLYNNGGEANILMIRPQDSLNVAAWKSGTAPGATAARTDYVDNANRKLYNVVDVYVTPFSDEGLKVVLNRFLRGTPAANAANGATTAGDALVFESAMWKKATLRNWFRKTLAITGDSTTVQILGEFSLKHRNYEASGLITNLA